MHYIFLSYARADIEISNKLRRGLLENDISLWRDLEDIRKDKGWDYEIEKILDSGKLTHFLFLETPSSCREDSVCRDEIIRAAQNGIPRIRLLFEQGGSLPLKMQRRTHIDFRTDYSDAFQQLLIELAKSPIQTPAVIHTNLVVVNKTPSSLQLEAAHDKANFVRLVAPPGSGKSFVIEERVRWLIENGVNPDAIYVASFTRASSDDLKERILRYCRSQGQNSVDEVHVSTLHSLALRVLRKEGLLTGYQASPKVLDKWEMEKIFDVEMGIEIQRTSTRCKEIREAYTAYCSTGKWTVPPHMMPDKPVTQEEIDAFSIHIDPLTQSYSCVLPSQIIKKCTDHIEKGLIQPVDSLKADHLIIDEYQDLNYTDTQFIHSFTVRNVPLFVAGDDDQSIYGFRYAYPLGIQQFVEKYRSKGASGRALTECFRCTPEILNVALDLLKNFQDPNARIPKTVTSQYAQTSPKVNGVSERWIFSSETKEAEAIARSCKELIEQGIEPQEILLLLSNRQIQLWAKKDSPSALEKAFLNKKVPLEIEAIKPYIDTESGRFAYAILRIACDEDLVDYAAHRTLLGLLKGVGPATCNNIRRAVLAQPHNYLDLFYNPIPAGMFNKIQQTAIDGVRLITNEITQWTKADTIGQHLERIAELLSNNFDEKAAAIWRTEVDNLPAEMNLEEVISYLEVKRDEQRAKILSRVYERLELTIPETGFFPKKVRVMTMHGIKGLEAQIVFIPGLEIGILPSEKSLKHIWLRYEAARLTYVSITRAKAAVIMSYAKTREFNGQRDYERKFSPFVSSLGGSFVQNDGSGLLPLQITKIVETVTALNALNEQPKNSE